MSRKPQVSTRSNFAKKICLALREFGYPSVTTEMVKSVIDAWIDDGKRGHDLPHGVIGMLAGRQLDELEESSPGRLALLDKS